MSFEARQKLAKHRPETLGQAARISGITPASISLLLIHLKKGGFKGFATVPSFGDRKRSIRMSRDVLNAGLASLGLALSDAQVTQLLDYLALLQKWNKVYNLTAVRNPAEMLTHHLLDSLAAINPLLRQTAGEAIKLLDVGSGGGLPGVVIAIVCPQIDVSCVDTVGKKAAFIQQAAATLRAAQPARRACPCRDAQGRAGRWV